MPCLFNTVPHCHGDMAPGPHQASRLLQAVGWADDTRATTESPPSVLVSGAPACTRCQPWVLLENVALDNFVDDEHKRTIHQRASSVGLVVLGSVNSKNVAGSLALRDRLYCTSCPPSGADLNAGTEPPCSPAWQEIVPCPPAWDSRSYFNVIDTKTHSYEMSMLNKWLADKFRQNPHQNPGDWQDLAVEGIGSGLCLRAIVRKFNLVL